MYYKVVGKGGVLIFGDLHISSKVAVGKHKNYIKNCFQALLQIQKIVETRKPDAVVFLGDLVGTVERIIQNREVLGIFCRFLKDIGKTAKIFAVRGNHDVGDYPEFEFISKDLGLVETAISTDGYFDYYSSEDSLEPEVRFHLVDYGNERTPLNLFGGKVVDIVLAHNDFQIPSETTWYQSKDGILLSNLDNFAGVYMVIAGHIHNPSPQPVGTEMRAGGVCYLFYPGCPTRPAERYESCWYVDLSWNNTTNECDLDTIEMKLEPTSEVFYDDDEYLEELTEEQLMDIERRQDLKAVLEEVMTYRIGSDNLTEQIMNIPNATEAAKKTACHYLQLGIDAVGV